jgi:predicted membrane channel-forming protein YqfA (hemolysin III family)
MLNLHLFQTTLLLSPEMLELPSLPSQRNRYVPLPPLPWIISSPKTRPVNIYTHLLGSLIFFALPWYLYTPRATLGDIIVFSIYFLGVGLCFFFSAMYVLSSSPAPLC